MNRIEYWKKLFESCFLTEWYNAPKLEDLKGLSYEAANEKFNGKLDYDLWTAAQWADPDDDIAKHGELGGCEVVGTANEKGFANEFYVKGYHIDGTIFERGPTSHRKQCVYYMQLHGISISKKTLDKIHADVNSLRRDSRFDISHKEDVIDPDTGKPTGKQIITKHIGGGLTEYGVYNKATKDYEDDPLFEILKFPDGFYLRTITGDFKVGPFNTKPLARAFAFHYTKSPFPKSNRQDEPDELPEHLNYPVFAFDYKMAGVDCMDIVCAETIQSAMKYFAAQWKIFDNNRVFKQAYRTVKDLERDMFGMRINNINIIELNSGNLDTYCELADQIGNPSTNPQLRTRCRNPKFRYILGIDKNTGRSPVTIQW